MNAQRKRAVQGILLWGGIIAFCIIIDAAVIYGVGKLIF